MITDNIPGLRKRRSHPGEEPPTRLLSWIRVRNFRAPEVVTSGATEVGGPSDGATTAVDQPVAESPEAPAQEDGSAVNRDQVRLDVDNGKKKASDIAIKVGIAGAIAFGALASGFLMSRRGRRFLRDVWNERRRSTLEDRVIDMIWGEPILGRRPVDVVEIEPGVIALVGEVRSAEEQKKMVEIAQTVKGVTEVEDRLKVRARVR